MFLALVFGLFLAVPLVLLVGSLGRTVVATTRGTADHTLQTEAPAPRLQARPAVAPAPALGSSALARGRRTRPAVPGGSRRDYFGDNLVAARQPQALTPAGS